jgi:Bacterial SH3 domain
MSRLLILLCMIGWALYIVHTNSNRNGHLVAQDSNASPSAATQAAPTSMQRQIRPIASATAQSPHAIIPDETQAPVPPPQTENTQTLSEAEQGLSPPPASSQQPEEELRVTTETSIRSGPSASAQLIGRAHAGATLRVKSREAGWVQFVDPVANETGWISTAYLGPIDAAGNNLQPSTSEKVKMPKPMPKMARLKHPKPPEPALVMRQIHPSYSELPADREFVPPRRSGLFGLFWRRRFSSEGGG